MAVVERVEKAGGDAQPRRRRWPAAAAVIAVVLVVALVAAWLIVTRPALVTGSTSGPAVGLAPLSDPIEQTKWLQTDEVGVLIMSVRNNGPFDAEMAAAPRDETGLAMPHLRVGFLPYDRRQGTPATTDWDALQGSVTVPSGGEAWVVVRFLYPQRCLGTLEDNGARYIFDSVALQQTVLGRTTAVDVPYWYPVNVPDSYNSGCSETDFGPLLALYPAR